MNNDEGRSTGSLSDWREHEWRRIANRNIVVPILMTLGLLIVGVADDLPEERRQQTLAAEVSSLRNETDELEVEFAALVHCGHRASARLSQASPEPACFCFASEGEGYRYCGDPDEVCAGSLKAGCEENGRYSCFSATSLPFGR